MMLQEFSAWFVWVLPLIASLFVPVIGKYSEKGRNYFVVAVAIVSAALAISLIPDVWGKLNCNLRYLAFGFARRIIRRCLHDPLSVLFMFSSVLV
jgi:NADH:ubiquinone oxidoreductase subunit 5 (subunit L)/multisubunit Na+/H+ antiporter MnhA subunit